MKLHRLKKIRVIVSLLIFIPISILFIDPTNNIPAFLSNSLTSIQFFPTLMKALAYSSFATTIILILISILTVFFGRVYCSTLCPLGTFQDLIIYFWKKLKISKKKFTYNKPPFVFHYSVFILTAVFALSGSLTLLNLFEPFSYYGKILVNIVEPIIVIINNLLANFLDDYRIFYFNNIPIRPLNIYILLGTILFLIFIIYLSTKKGRFFCNSLCPTGAILSLLSHLSIFKIVISPNKCNECNACEKVCKASCIESKTKKINFAACINCFNCIKSCPEEAITYSYNSYKRSIKHKHNSSRRKFFGELLTFTVLLTPFTNKQVDTTITKKYSSNKKTPIVPPGAKSVENFTNLCTACHLCVSMCPTQVLYPTFTEYGVLGIFQPKMNYEASYCNYECNICSQICPSGAITPVEVTEKKLIQIGKAVFIKEYCVVVDKKKDCAACSEHCPTKAVYMVPYENSLKIPELNNDICIGCGACEHVCPTTPKKAIYVESNKIHQRAKQPIVNKQEKVLEMQKDFPF